MKKLLIALLLLSIPYAKSFSQGCVIDLNNQELIAPASDQFPCVEKTVAFSSVIQVSVPASYDVSGVPVTIDSIVISSITNFPSGISYEANPSSASVAGGQNMCLNIEGTTTDTVGTYSLVFDGYAKTSFGQFSFADLAGFGFVLGYSLDVIDAGGNCRAITSIDKQKDFTTSINIFPNPVHENLNVELSSENTNSINVSIISLLGEVKTQENLLVTGKIEQKIDVSSYPKGMYILRCNQESNIVSKTFIVQ